MNGELLLNDTNNDETRCHGVHSSTRKKEHFTGIFIASQHNSENIKTNTSIVFTSQPTNSYLYLYVIPNNPTSHNHATHTHLSLMQMQE
jgi:hypothetical protein